MFHVNIFTWFSGRGTSVLDIFLPFLKKESDGTYKFTLVIFLSEFNMEALFQLYALIACHQELQPNLG